MLWSLGAALIMVAGMLIRPWRSSEWMWAVGGAVAQLALGVLTLPSAWTAIQNGTDVYLFLLGILALAEIARSQGVFTWLAGWGDTVAGTSRHRLFLLLYGVGVLVTATLSNDTAIILLTPAALALARRIGGSPLPYVFAMAFVANAASFLLPTGNPANLLLYGSALPSLFDWIRIYGIASLATIFFTYLALVWLYRVELKRSIEIREERPRSSANGRLAFGILIASALALLLASIKDLPLGATAFVCAAIAFLCLSIRDRSVVGYVARGVSWSIVPLVACLLVVVAALEAVGVTQVARAALAGASSLPPWIASEVIGSTTAALANVANNLPIAAFASRALGAASTPLVTHAVMVGIDVGPNLSLSGSLATILWLLILRRDGIIVTPLQFLKRGAFVLAPALFAGLLALR